MCRLFRPHKIKTEDLQWTATIVITIWRTSADDQSAYNPTHRYRGFGNDVRLFLGNRNRILIPEQNPTQNPD
jgi:hypothetical protein